MYLKASLSGRTLAMGLNLPMPALIKWFLFTLVFWLLGYPDVAQATNAVPQINHLRAKVDLPRGEVAITYDLLDSENDTIRITFRASHDGGLTYRDPAGSVSGDIGYPIRHHL